MLQSYAETWSQDSFKLPREKKMHVFFLNIGVFWIFYDVISVIYLVRIQTEGIKCMALSSAWMTLFQMRPKETKDEYIT